MDRDLLGTVSVGWLPVGIEHTRFGGLKPTRREADANLCGEALRENALCAFVAAAGCATMAWLGLYGFAWNDYETEARPAFEALVHGHVLRVPAARARLRRLAGRARAVRAAARAVGRRRARRLPHGRAALPARGGACSACGCVARMRAQGRSTLARAVALGVCVANPITLRALELGHPEELLGACLCVAAVLLAARSASGRDRSLLAGALLGLAIANKEWALLAAGPVLLALPPGRRARCLASAGVSRRRGARAARARRARAASSRARRAVAALGGERDLPAVAGVVVLRPPRRARARAVRRRPSPATASRRRGRARSATR